MPRRTSLAKIQSQIRDLRARADQLERSSSKGMRAATKLIRKYGLSMDDLRSAFEQSRSKRSGRVGVKPGTKVAPKYRDSDGNTWTGRGLPPRWLVKAEAAGKKRESFLIEAAKAANRAKPRK